MNRLLFAIGFAMITLTLIQCGNSTKNDPEVEAITDSLAFETDTLGEKLRENTTDEPDTVILNAINRYIDAAIEGDMQFLADNTEYPISRKSPLPGWSDQNDFKNSFSETFDDSLIGLFHKFQLNPEIIDRTGVTGEVGILDGGLWFTPEGLLTGMNYVATDEEFNRKQLETEIKNEIHPALRSYEYNLFTGTTADDILRIDETEKGLRYAQWSKSFTMADEPDFILYDGEWEQKGSAGGWQITFEKNEGNLVVKNVAICLEAEDCGYFLINKNGEARIDRELDELSLVKG